jgi:alkylhydroperoxidase family enzyme
MPRYPIHTLESAPESSKPPLRELLEAFGIIPNLAGAMANSPTLIKGFWPLFQSVHKGRFTEAQIQALLLTNAVVNAAEWPVAFHTALALKAGLDPTDVEAIRQRRAPADAGTAALSALARTLIERRGRVEDQDLDAFVAAGFDEEQVLEAIAVSAASTITNYLASVARPSLEEAFQRYAWNA